jgi:hypothetical protein
LSDEEVQRFIAEVCLGGIADGKIECDLLGLLHRDGVSTRDATILARAPRRLALYRRLVRGNLLGVTSRMMPRTRARLNDLANDAFDRSFSAFLATAAPRTHYLRDVPAEFLAWALPTWKANLSIPAYAADLANHELVEFQIAAAPMRSECPPLAELALDRVLLFVTARRLVHYAHAVHTLPPDEGDRSEPVVRNVALFIHRDRDNRVRFLELTPLAAHIVDRLLARVPLGEAIAQACNAEGTPLTESVLASTARVLSDWGERGILLGAEG